MSNTKHGIQASKEASPSKKPRREYHSLTIGEKAQFIASGQAAKQKDEKASISSIGREHGIKASWVALRTWNERHKIQAMMENLPTHAANQIMRSSKRPMQVVEEVLVDWCVKERKNGCNVSDIRLQGAACTLWSTMKDYFIESQRPEPIAFSCGWLRNFKRRYGAQLRVGYGESGSVNLEAYRAQIDEIKETLATFPLENIYNCDETGLYLKALSNKTIDIGPIHSRKIIRAARVSILLCSNATGSDKLKLFVLSKNCPKGLDERTLKCIDADMNCSGYMAQVQFDKWLKDLDDDMRQQRRKIALLLDGAPGHCGSSQVGLTNITVVQLPAKTTSITQPLDAGIIRSFKVKYTQQMFEIISQARAETNNPEATVPNGVLWSCFVNAWEGVTPKCIRNCFHSVPVMPTTHKVQLQSLGTESPDEEITRLQQELGEKHQALKDVVSKQKNDSILNYINMCYVEGPSKSILESAMKIIKDERFRDAFKQYKENDFIEEDEVSEEDDLDKDDEFPQRSNKENVAFVLRSRTVTTPRIFITGIKSTKKEPEQR